MRDEFYDIRDKRSREYGVVDKLSEAPVRVVVGDDAAECPRGQILFLSLVNLLSRFHRRLALIVPRKKLVVRKALGRVSGSGNLDLHDAAVAIAQANDPFISLDDRSESNHAIGIGLASKADAPWFVSTNDNIVQLANDPSPIDRADGFSLGPCLGACIASWSLFQQVSGGTIKPQRISAWNLRDEEDAIAGPSSLGPLDVGRVLMLGAGGVGSCLAFWLSLVGVKGSWLVVDGDSAKLHNANRSLGITAVDAGWPTGKGEEKARLAAELLGVQHRTCWHDALSEDDYKVDLVLPLANERGVRTRVAMLGMPILLHATTSRNFEAQLHRHIPERDDCIICRLPKKDDPSAFKCAEVTIKGEEGSSDASLAFLSGAAGVMLASALYRLASGEIAKEEHNWFRLAFRSVHRLAYRGNFACKMDCQGIPRSVRRITQESSRWACIDAV